MRYVDLSKAHRTIALTLAAAIVFSLAAAGTVYAAKGSAKLPSFVDYAQCANGAPPGTSSACPQGWINGILQGSNSHYSEDEVTPQRAELLVPSGAALNGHSFTFRYEARKGSIHAYDSLATWNLTQKNADRCQGLAPSDCVGGSPSTLAIPNDPAVVAPIGSGIDGHTSAHMIAAGSGRVMTMYGGTLTNISVPVHDCLSPCTGDDYATVTVTYNVASANRKVQLLFGGHLAASGGPRGWGSSVGSGNISGGPYHIKWNAVDGASVGNRDNQIMGAAILSPPSLLVSKTADHTSVSAGSPIGFTISVQNTGTTNATNVTLNDPLPGGTGIDWSISPAYTGQGTCAITGTPATSETLACSFGTLTPGQTVSVHVASPTTADTSGTLNNTATAQSDNAPSSSASASESVLQPHLTIDKTADDHTVSAGDPIGFTITVTNTGPGTAVNASISDPLPTGTGINWSISPAYTGPGTCAITTVSSVQHLNCSFGNLAPNAGATVHILSQTTKDTAGTIANTATVHADNSNPDASASDQSTVDTPHLGILKTADAGSVSAGDDIGFTMTVTNTGDGVAESASLSDNLPAATGVSWSISPAYTGPGTCSITGSVPSQVLSCSFGNLATNASATVHVLSHTTAATSGPIANTAVAQASNNDQVSDSDTTTVNGVGLHVLKTADDASVSAGDQIGFTIAGSNTGPGTAQSAGLSDPLPGGTGVIWSISPTYAGPGTCSITGTAPNQTLSCSFGNLAAGDTFSVHIVSATTSATSGAFTNKATLSASNATSQDSTASTTVLKPNLFDTKTSDNATVDSGSPIGFSIRVQNGGPGVAKNASLNDPLPTATGIDWTLSTYTGPGTCAITGTPPSETLSCSFGDLASGADFIVHVSSNTTGATSGTITNTATVSASNAPSSNSTATTTALQPHLTISKTADTASVSSGDNLGFTIAVGNDGDGTAKNVTLSDPLPTGSGVAWVIDQASANAADCSISGTAPAAQTLSCSFGNLAKDASKSVHVTSATKKDTSGALPNTATTQADNNGPVTSSATITVLQPHLVIDKSPDASPVKALGPIGFTITVSSDGQGTARNVTLSDTLPSLAGVSWSLDPTVAGCSISGSPQVLVCSFGDLAPDATRTVHITSATTKDTVGTLNNTAATKADNFDEITDSASIEVIRATLDVSGSPCLPNVPPGGTTKFQIDYANTGNADATNTVLTATVPTGSTVTDPDGGIVAPDGSIVTWSLGTLDVGASGSKVLTLLVAPDVADGTVLTSTVTLSSPDAPDDTATISVTVSTAGTAASGRAYGLSATLLNGALPSIAPTPDTDQPDQNPGQLAGPIDVANGTLHADLASVSESHSTDGGFAQDQATAVTADLAVHVGALTVSAETLAARSVSTAGPADANSSTAGSRVQNLIVNGVSYGDLTSSKTITVNDPSGTRIATVRVLEISDALGAAAGDAQPDAAGLFSSGVTVRALHIIVDDLAATPLVNEASDIVVAFAKSFASYPSGLPCGEAGPSVAGQAFVARTDNVNPPLADGRVGVVSLPSPGGNVTQTVADLGTLGTVTGLSHTDGSLSPSPQVFSHAQVNDLNLLGGQITAKTIDATSDTDGIPVGDTTIEDLRIGNVDVCATLGLASACHPDAGHTLLLDAGHVIVVLNEQLDENGGTRVNAVHIFVVGPNHLDLPAGADLIIASAWAAANS